MLVLLSAQMGPGLAAHAQPQNLADAPPEIHWAYSAFFGSGYYQFGDSPGVTILRADLRQEIREPSLEDDRRKPGITLRLPVTVGHQGELNSPDDLAAASLDTLSFVPGVEFTLPLGERWTIKPFTNVGYGWASGGAESASIYRAGAASRYTFDARRFRWSIISSLTLIGFSDSGHHSQQSVPLTLALEATVPLKTHRINEQPVHLHWHVLHTHYLGKLEFLEDLGGSFLGLDREWEFGAAFGKDGERLRLWKLSWDRVGLGLRVDSNGDLAGVRLNFRSVFDL